MARGLRPVPPVKPVPPVATATPVRPAGGTVVEAHWQRTPAGRWVWVQSYARGGSARR